jgi:hypothetical protein
MMRAVLLLFTVMPALSALGERGQDPTEPPAGLNLVSAAASVPTPKLTSVLIAPDRRLAVIDGVTLAQGTSHGGLQLLEVTPSGAKVRKDGRTIQLRLSDSNMTKEWRTP